jgi:hypothetical protein
MTVNSLARLPAGRITLPRRQVAGTASYGADPGADLGRKNAELAGVFESRIAFLDPLGYAETA